MQRAREMLGSDRVGIRLDQRRQVEGQLGRLVMCDGPRPGEVEAAQLIHDPPPHVHAEQIPFTAVVTPTEQTEVGAAPALLQGGAEAAVEWADGHHSSSWSKAAMARCMSARTADTSCRSERTGARAQVGQQPAQPAAEVGERGQLAREAEGLRLLVVGRGERRGHVQYGIAAKAIDGGVHLVVGQLPGARHQRGEPGPSTRRVPIGRSANSNAGGHVAPSADGNPKPATGVESRKWSELPRLRCSLWHASRVRL